MTHSIFITGTDTDVGKTYITALIARQLRSRGVSVGCCKPVCSGSIWENDQERWGDIEALHAALGGKFSRELICPHRFTAPLAPPMAARRENRELPLDAFSTAIDRWNNRVDMLLIEGVGGLLCPLTETETIADLIARLRTPVLVVGRLGLGTLNHTLLTCAEIRRRGFDLRGVVLSDGSPDADDPSRQQNPQELIDRGVSVLGWLPYDEDRFRNAAGEPIEINWSSIITGGEG